MPSSWNPQSFFGVCSQFGCPGHTKTGSKCPFNRVQACRDKAQRILIRIGKLDRISEASDIEKLLPRLARLLLCLRWHRKTQVDVKVSEWTQKLRSANYNPDQAQQIRDLSQKLEQSERERNDLGSKLDREIQDKLKFEEEKSRLEDENTRLENEITRLEDKNSRVENENSRVEDENTRLENENTQLQSEKTALQTRLENNNIGLSQIGRAHV